MIMRLREWVIKYDKTQTFPYIAKATEIFIINEISNDWDVAL
jgi:hypothetical protein